MIWVPVEIQMACRKLVGYLGTDHRAQSYYVPSASQNRNKKLGFCSQRIDSGKLRSLGCLASQLSGVSGAPCCNPDRRQKAPCDGSRSRTLTFTTAAVRPTSEHRNGMCQAAPPSFAPRLPAVPICGFRMPPQQRIGTRHFHHRRNGGLRPPDPPPTAPSPARTSPPGRIGRAGGEAGRLRVPSPRLTPPLPPSPRPPKPPRVVALPPPSDRRASHVRQAFVHAMPGTLGEPWPQACHGRRFVSSTDTARFPFAPRWTQRRLPLSFSTEWRCQASWQGWQAGWQEVKSVLLASKQHPVPRGGRVASPRHSRSGCPAASKLCTVGPSARPTSMLLTQAWCAAASCCVGWWWSRRARACENCSSYA